MAPRNPPPPPVDLHANSNSYIDRQQRDQAIEDLHREKAKVANLEKDVRDMEYNLNSVKAAGESRVQQLEGTIA